MVCRWRFAYVFDGMHLVGGLEDDGAGAYLLHFAVDQRFNGPFFDDNNFFFGVFVRRVRAVAWV